jgi:hypothetical protein
MNMGTDRASAQTRHRSSDRNDGLPPHVRRAQLQKFLNIRHGFTLPDNAVGRAAAYQMCNLLAQEPDAVPHIGHWLDLNCRWMAKAERDDLLRRVIWRPMPFAPDRVAQELGGPTKAEREHYRLWNLGIIA